MIFVILFITICKKIRSLVLFHIPSHHSLHHYEFFHAIHAPLIAPHRVCARVFGSGGPGRGGQDVEPRPHVAHRRGIGHGRGRRRLQQGVYGPLVAQRHEHVAYARQDEDQETQHHARPQTPPFWPQQRQGFRNQLPIHERTLRPLAVSSLSRTAACLAVVQTLSASPSTSCSAHASMSRPGEGVTGLAECSWDLRHSSVLIV